MAKYLLLSLSFGRLDRDRFALRFGEELGDRFREPLARARDEGWLDDDERGFRLRSPRFDALPSIRALFYSDAAIAWLVDQSMTSKVVRPTS